MEPRFIFGPLGDGYRLTRAEHLVCEAIGLVFAISGCVLLVLAKMSLVDIGVGLGGGALLFVAAFIAMKAYVALAGIPKIKRPLPEGILSNISRRRHFYLYGLPIAFGLMLVVAIVFATTHAAEMSLSLSVVLAALGALFLGSLILAALIKRKLAARNYEGLK